MTVDAAGSTGTAAKPALGRVRSFFGRLRGPAGVYAGGIAIALAVAALQVSDAVDTWNRAHRDAERSVGNLTLIAEQEIARTLQSVDLSLKTIVELIALSPPHRLDDPEVETAMKERLKDLPFVRIILVIGADGKTVRSTFGPAVPETVRVDDRPYFTAQRDDAALGLFIDKPAVGRRSQLLSIPMSRRISGPDGTFGGVIVAFVDPIALMDVYGNIDVGPGGAIAIIKTDGTILARHPYREEFIGRDVRATPLFREHLPRSRTGVAEGTQTLDGVPRLFGYRALNAFPVVVFVGLESGRIQAESWANIAVGIGSALAFVAAIVLVTFFLARAMRRQEKLLEDVRASESRFRDYTEAMSDWYWETDPEHRVLFMSERPTIHGIQTKSRVGMRRWEIATDVVDEPEKWRRHRDLLERRQPFRDFMYRSEPSEGKTVYNSVSGKPHYDENGRFLGYRGTARDVTAQVLAEQAAKKARTLLADAVESLSDGFALYGPDDRLIMCNSRYRKGVHPSIPAEPGTPFADVVAASAPLIALPDDLAATEAEWIEQRMRRHREGTASPMERMRKDGKWLRVVETRTSDGGTVILNIDITALKQAEQAANQSRARLADAIESLPDGFALFDAQDRFVMCNSAYRRFVLPTIDLKPGLAFYDLISKAVEFFVFPTELGATPEAWLQERMRRHRDPGPPMEWQLKDGRWMRAVEARTGDGGTVVLNIDVTQRKHSEQEAQSARNLLADAIDSLPDAFAIFDRDDRLIHANWEYLRHLNVKPTPGVSTFTDMLPNVAAQISLPDALGATPGEWMAERTRRHRAPGAPFELRYRNGMWGRVVETRTRDGGMAMLRTDITQPKLREQAVERLAQQQTALATLSQLALKTADPIQLCQHAVEMIAKALSVELASALEYDPEGAKVILRAAIGWQPGSIGAEIPTGTRSLAGLTLAANKPLVVEDLARETRFEPSRMLRDHKVRSAITVVIPGTPRPFGALGAYSIEPRTFGQGEIEFMQATAFVLSTSIERQKAEQMLAQAQRLESLGKLTGGIAHDFNNLLTVIIGQSDLLAGDLKGAPMQSEMALTIGIAAKRAAELTDQLLSFARGQTLQLAMVDVNRLIGDTEPLLRRTLGEHIEIRVALGQGLPPCRTDRTQLANALINLAVNARDAMPNGGRLTIETSRIVLDSAYAAAHSEIAPGEYLMIAISDTGQGMTPEVLARAFEPFFTTKAVGRGTGLGLSMVYGFVKQSGGHVSAYSEVGHGTTIKLYLPIAAGIGTGEPVAAAAADASGDASEAADGRTILMVEDNDMVRAFTAAQLKRLGYAVIEARNGPEALGRLRDRTRIDLLFSDIVMPGGMSGPQVADNARRLRPGLPVLLTSGYPAGALSNLPLGGQEFDILNKPYRLADLAQRIRAVLDRK